MPPEVPALAKHDVTVRMSDDIGALFNEAPRFQQPVFRPEIVAIKKGRAKALSHFDTAIAGNSRIPFVGFKIFCARAERGMRYRPGNVIRTVQYDNDLAS